MPGWALNLSRGGLRAVIEDRVELGESLSIQIAEINVTRQGTVVWVQDEPDGAIVGVAFDQHIEAAPGVDLETSINLTGPMASDLGVPPVPEQGEGPPADPGTSREGPAK